MPNLDTEHIRTTLPGSIAVTAVLDAAAPYGRWQCLPDDVWLTLEMLPRPHEYGEAN